MVDNRDAYEIYTVQHQLERFKHQESSFVDPIGVSGRETTLIVTLLFLYTYQVLLAMKVMRYDDQDSPLWKMVLKALFYIPLSVIENLIKIFRVTILLCYLHYIFNRFCTRRAVSETSIRFTEPIQTAVPLEHGNNEQQQIVCPATIHYANEISGTIDCP